MATPPPSMPRALRPSGYSGGRVSAAGRIGCAPEEVLFTSGGTEANNLAIFGAAQSLARRGHRIVTTAIEHPSVEKPVKELERQGFEVVFLPAGEDGKVRREDLLEAVNSDTILVSMMAVNNEVGSLQPLEAVRGAIKRAGAPALFHCDCVQGFGKLEVKPAALGIDLMTVSSHKIHVGFGAACAALPEEKAGLAHAAELRDYLLEQLSSLRGITINSPPDALPYIVNLSIPGMRSEPVLNLLSEMGVYVSSGSACAKGHKSPVLTALGLPDTRIDSALRISFSRFTTQQEIDALVAGIKRVQQVLRRV